MSPSTRRAYQNFIGGVPVGNNRPAMPAYGRDRQVPHDPLAPDPKRRSVCRDEPAASLDRPSKIGAGCSGSLPYNPFDIIDTNTTEGVDIMTSEK